MRIIVAISLGLFLSFSVGCGYSFFAAKTTASYKTPDGKEIQYSSDKEQVGLDVKYVLDADGKVKEIHIKVEKAGSQEQAIAAALQQSQATNALLQSLMPLIMKAASLAGGS